MLTLRPQFGAVIWAAVDTSPGFTPQGLVAEIRRNARYPAAEWRAVLTEEPLDPHAISTRFQAALDEAEAFVGLHKSCAMSINSTGLPTACASIRVNIR